MNKLYDGIYNYIHELFYMNVIIASVTDKNYQQYPIFIIIII